MRRDVPNGARIDVAALEEEATAWLLGRFRVTNDMYFLPQAYRGDEHTKFFVMIRMIQWGGPLAEAEHRINHRVLAAWAFNRFDPAEGGEVEAFCAWRQLTAGQG